MVDYRSTMYQAASMEQEAFINIFENRTFLKYFAAFNITWIAVVAGLAIGMYSFSVPVIEDARGFSTQVMLRQFHHLIRLGIKYIQQGSRVQGVTLALLTWMFYRHPDEAISQAWPYFAASLLVGLQVAWYEVVFVFPINDKLIEMEGILEKMDEKADRAMRDEVLELLEQWRKWHIGRIVIPFAAIGVAVAGLSLPCANETFLL